MNPTDIILNALHAAADNAHDMGLWTGPNGVDWWTSSDDTTPITTAQYALLVVLEDLFSGEPSDPPESPYFDLDDEPTPPRADLRGAVPGALAAFLSA